MEKETFNLKLKDYDLSDPQKKKYYNEQLFSEVAPRYDSVTKFLSFGRDKFWKKRLVRDLPSNNIMNCLDIASGTGDITFALAEKYPEAKVLGIDLNKTMITRSSMLNTTDNVRLKISDMCDLTEEDNTFDIVTGGYALRNAPDLLIALNEIKRVMKPGATASFLDFSKSNIKFIQIIQIFLLRVWGNIWGLIMHKNPEIYGYIAESLKKYPDRKRMNQLLRELGFINIKSKKIFFGFLELLIFEK